ncbi:lysylphosphatidylglycerol synthase domain-containing protein, partial [Mangrovicoccus algicola]|nr:flippase-like domain-containing protein [Mangrovicoccus algicola]
MSALRPLLSVALVAAVLALPGIEQVAARLRAAEALWLGLCLLLLTLVTLLSALRWRLTAAALGLDLRPGRAIREYYLAQIVNLTLPGGVLGDAARAMRTRGTGPLGPAAQAVVLERAAGQAAMAAVL